MHECVLRIHRRASLDFLLFIVWSTSIRVPNGQIFFSIYIQTNVSLKKHSCCSIIYQIILAFRNREQGYEWECECTNFCLCTGVHLFRLWILHEVWWDWMKKTPHMFVPKDTQVCIRLNLHVKNTWGTFPRFCVVQCNARGLVCHVSAFFKLCSFGNVFNTFLGHC